MCHLIPSKNPGTVPMEELLTLRDFRARLPKRNGRRVDLATVYRWVNRGIGGARLRTVRVGGVMYTSMEWAWEFLNREQRTDASAAVAPAGAQVRRVPAMTPAQERRQLDRDLAAAAKLGLIKASA